MAVEIEPDRYCRDLEAYLCRKNDGHLVRIVGPAFEQVCGWAARGVPLAVAQRGIDRYFERYYAKGPRRRPIRIEFCEADVLDAFDEWRRALGVTATSESSNASFVRDGEAGAVFEAKPSADGSRHSLPAHLERTVARLTVARAGAPPALDAAIDAAVRELETMRGSARGLRGQARHPCLERLTTLDAQLLAAARATCDEAALADLGREADAELAPFRDRMLGDAYERSRRAGVDRLLRERHRLPLVALP